MATKPSSGATVNGAHPYAPRHCFLMNEGSGRPTDIGISPLPTGGGDTPTWATQGGFGIITQWDGTKHVTYGTGSFLNGLTKLTLVVSVAPDGVLGWGQTGAFIAKKVAWDTGNVFACGVVNDSEFGPHLFFEIGNGTSGDNPKVYYGWYVSPTPIAQTQLMFCYDGSRSAGDRVRLYRDGVQVTSGFNSGSPAWADTAAWAVPNDTTTTISMGEGSGRSQLPIGEFKGDLGYLYIIPDLFPSATDVAALYNAPYQFMTGAVPVVAVETLGTLLPAGSGLPARGTAYKKSPSGVVTRSMRFTRYGSTSGALAVEVALSGGAVNGTDYTTIASPVTIPDGSATLDLVLSPLDTVSLVEPKLATLTIQTDAAYDVSATDAAHVEVRVRQRDQYGAVAPAAVSTRLNSVSAPLWDLQKINTRWMFISPEGNGMWLRGVYVMDITTPQQSTKYGGSVTHYALHALRSVRSWGFNADGGYSALGTIPNELMSGTLVSGEDRTPFIWQFNPMDYARRNGDFKSIYHWANPTWLNASADYRGRNWPDAYDPAFQTYYENFPNGMNLVTGGFPAFADSPWVLFIRLDDGDYVFGVGPGPTGEASQGKIIPHVASIALISSPTGQSYNWNGAHIGRYADSKLYTKYAMRDWLQTQYASLAAFNTAWGASYTSWDSVDTARTGESVAELCLDVVRADATNGASITSGLTTVTLGAGATVFQASDVGRAILIAGAGVAGADLLTGITVYTNPTTVTVATAASTTVSNADFSIFREAVLGYGTDTYVLGQPNMFAGGGDAFGYKWHGAAGRTFAASGVPLLGTGVRLAYTSLLPITYPPFTPANMQNTVTIKVGGVARGTDNGSGTITGATIASGTVNYTTGAIAFTFTAGNAPAVGATITVDYTGNGWGVGGGFLDEDGRHSWVNGGGAFVDTLYLATFNAAAQADLDGFLYEMAAQYFSVASTVVRALFPGKMVAGPPSFQAGTRDPVLQAAGDHLDIIEVSGVPRDSATHALFQHAYAVAQKPLFVWLTLDQYGDSDMNSVPAGTLTLGAGYNGARGTEFSVTSSVAAFTGSAGISGITEDPALGTGWAVFVGITNTTQATARVIYPFSTNSYTSGQWQVSGDAWDGDPGYSAQTQPLRGAAYDDELMTLYSMQEGGDYCIAGIAWWQHGNNLSELHGFGFVTSKDCAYDGVQAMVATSTDYWGVAMGGEARNYGDFITPVRATNEAIDAGLALELEGQNTHSVGWITRLGPHGVSMRHLAEVGPQVLTVDVGAVGITGTAISLLAGRQLTVDSGAVSLTGTDVALVYSSAPSGGFPDLHATTSGGATVVNSPNLILVNPVGSAAGDRVIHVVGIDGSSTFTAPTGWTLGASVLSATSIRLVILYRILTGGADDTIDGSAGHGAGAITPTDQMYSYAGHRFLVGTFDSATAPHIVTAARPTGLTSDCPAATAPWGSANNHFLAGAVFDGGNRTVGDTAPTNYTAVRAEGGGGSNQSTITITAERDFTSATDDPDTVAIVGGNQLSVAFTIITKPGSAVGAYTLTVDPGAVGIAGTDVGLTYVPVGGHTLTVDPGSVAITGTAVTPRATRVLTVDQGAVGITGLIVNLTHGALNDYVLTVEPGAMPITGTVVDLNAPADAPTPLIEITLTGGGRRVPLFSGMPTMIDLVGGAGAPEILP